MRSFSERPAERLSGHRLVVGNNGLCVDVYGNSGTPDAAIEQWSCNGQSSQQFQFAPGSNGYGERAGAELRSGGGGRRRFDLTGRPGHRAAGA
jgi:hypothetical protein